MFSLRSIPLKNKRKNASSKLTCPLITLTSYSIPVTIAFLCVKLCSFNELYQWRYSSIHCSYLRIELPACNHYRQTGLFSLITLSVLNFVSYQAHITPRSYCAVPQLSAKSQLFRFSSLKSFIRGFFIVKPTTLIQSPCFFQCTHSSIFH